MTEHGIEVPHSLIEYAQDLQSELTNEPFDRRMLLAIEALHLLEVCNIGNYSEESGLVIDSSLSFWKRKQDTGRQQEIVIFGSLALEGYAPNFSYLSLGDIELHPINSLCLALSKVTLLPGGDSLPENDQIHIPVLAVEQVLQFA